MRTLPRLAAALTIAGLAPLLHGAALPQGVPVAPAPGSDDAALAAAIPLPELDVDDLAPWVARIRPDAHEAAFESVDWLPDMVSGLRRAEAEQKPLLLWLMNGHPLGCT